MLETYFYVYITIIWMSDTFMFYTLDCKLRQVVPQNFIFCHLNAIMKTNTNISNTWNYNKHVVDCLSNKIQEVSKSIKSVIMKKQINRTQSS